MKNTMYYVILMLVSVSGREIPHYIYNNEPRQERIVPYHPVDTINYNNHQNGFMNINNHAPYPQNNRESINNDRNERPCVNPSLERNHRDRPDNVNSHSQNGFVSANNPEQLNVRNNREFIPDHVYRNDRSWNSYANQDHIQLNLNNQKQLTAQSNRGFIPQERLTSDKSTGNQGNNAHNNREFIPNDSNTRNDRNWNPHINQARPDAFNNEQYNEQNNRQIIPNHDRRHDRNSYIQTNQGHSPSNSNHEQLNEQNNRGLIPDENINDAYQGRSHDGDINLAYERQGNSRREHSKLNLPRQTFNVNNEYSNRDTNRSTKNRNNQYNENILHARRHRDEITLEGYNRETQTNHRRNSQENNNGMISFLNNLNYTNQTNPSRNHSGFRQTNTKPKTAMENEVTPNPLQNGNADRDNGTVDNDWVWGVDDTTTISSVTLDDRAAFSGDKCSTGMVRFRGKCVTED